MKSFSARFYNWRFWDPTGEQIEEAILQNFYDTIEFIAEIKDLVRDSLEGEHFDDDRT